MPKAITTAPITPAPTGISAEHRDKAARVAEWLINSVHAQTVETDLQVDADAIRNVATAIESLDRVARGAMP